MSLSPNFHENSPEPTMAEVCLNLDNEFLNVQDLSKGEGMNVYARVRPMLNSEIEAGYKECIASVDDHTVRAIFPPSSSKYKTNSLHNQDIIEDFTFTSAFGPETGQFVFFEECMMNTMQNFIEGQNSLVFSYGSTGSGKTFTLQGNSENPGIIPMSLHLFFASIQDHLLPKVDVKPEKFADIIILNDNERKKEVQLKEQLISGSDQEQECKSSSKKSLGMVLCETFSEKFEVEERQTTLEPEEMAQAQAAAVMKEMSQLSAKRQSGYCNIWVSFVEIYNENAYDLLQPNINQRTKLNLGEDKNGDVYVKGLREVCVNNSWEALKLLSLGQKNLKIASTKLNYQSSRSHCIFTVKVIRVSDLENITYAKVNRLSFCDLAGSERAAKSQTTGMRLKEAGCINTSLLVLGRCLEQIRLNSTLKDKKMIPFRESKLTRLFSGFFTGRGKAVMIANASPSELTFDETLHVLRFSALAKELIINDSYITTASNTLQKITNMWASARANTSNTSDKSISFEDSMEDVIQEKDELIEKLLDLAESLRNNLEREKKEKAELEMKIRQDVCQEYSEYSDQLLESQRQALEDEQEAIKEVYDKRIANMEKMYERIIDGYKTQLNESYSSSDEATDELSESLKIESGNVELEDRENYENLQGQNTNSDFIDETKFEVKDTENVSERYILEIELLKSDLLRVNEELKKTKAELQKVINHATSLENASIEMEKEMKTSNQNLQRALVEKEQLQKENENLQASYQEEIINLEKEKQLESHVAVTNESEIQILQEKLCAAQLELEEALKSNDELKNEFDAFKIDFVFYKNDYTNLLAKKSEYEEKFKSFSSELDDAKHKNADLEEHLQSTENAMSVLKETISVMENDIAKYKEKLHIQNNLEVALAQQLKETEAAKEALKEADKAFENISEISRGYEARIQELEAECCTLQNSKAALLKENEIMSLKFATSIEELKNENKNLKNELDKALESVSCLKESISVSGAQITELTNNLEEQKNLVKVLKKNEKDSQDMKELFEARSKALENADIISEEQKQKIEALELECSSLRNRIADLSKNKEDLDDGYTSLLLELDNIKQENAKLKNKIENAEKSTSSSKKLVADLEIQLAHLTNELEKQKQLEEVKRQKEKDAENAYELLEDVNASLKSTTALAEELKKKIELTETENSSLKNDVVCLQKIKEDLQENIASIIKELDVEKDNLKIKNAELLQVLQESSGQKEEINSLRAECTSFKNEISALQEIVCSFQNNLSHPSNDLDLQNLKQKIETLNSELKESLEIIEKQKGKIDALEEQNITLKEKISELQKTEEKLTEEIKISSDKLAAIELCHKEELNTVSKKLEETLKLNDNLAKEIEDLQNEYAVSKSEISQLQQLKADFVEKLNTQASLSDMQNLKQKIETLNSELKESLEIIEKQKVKIDALEEQNITLKEMISELQKTEKKLVEEIKNASDKLAGIELHHKDELDTSTKKFEETFKLNKNLEKEIENIQKECTVHKSEISQLQQLRADLEEKLSTQASLTDCEVLHKMVQILQRCEVRASNKAKQLHSSSIKHVEQIMDLEKCIKRKESNIESLQNEYNTLQKKFKDFQTTSKKELQSEKQQYEVDIESIKKKNAVIEKENDVLKLKLNQLEKEKEVLTTEAETLRNLSQKAEEENKNDKSKTNDLVIPVEKLEDAEKYEKDTKRPKSSVSKKSKDENQKVSSQKNQSKKRQSSEKDENKKIGIIDVEEIGKTSGKNLNKHFENTNRDTQEVKKAPRRHLRNVGNVTIDIDLIPNKNPKDAIKSKSSKRKGRDELFEEKEPAQKSMKKMKLQDLKDSENKPQNLRIQLLKGKTVKEEVSRLSPRVTRGRKRLLNSELFQSKENTGNKSQRTVRW